MIVTLFIVFLTISLVAFFEDEKREVANEYFFLIFGLVLIIFAGFRDGNTVKDYNEYERLFDYPTDLIEPSFALITKIIKEYFFGTAIWMFVVYSILGVTLKLLAIKRLSTILFLPLLIYISYFYILHEFTQIRAGVAAGFLLLCVRPIIERDWKRFILFGGLGFAFHYSALVIFPLWFLTAKLNRRIFATLIPAGYLLYFTGANLITKIPIGSIQEKLEIYRALQDSGQTEWTDINVFNGVFLFKLVIYYVLLWKYDYLLLYNKFLPVLMKIYCISLSSFLIFANMPIIAFRISELYGVVEIILFPMILYIFKPINFSRMIVIGISLMTMIIVIFYNKLIFE